MILRVLQSRLEFQKRILASILEAQISAAVVPSYFQTRLEPIENPLTPKRSSKENDRQTVQSLNAFKTCLDNNKSWAAMKVAKDPDYFKRWSTSQSPDFLWIGCSDSRVVPCDIIGKASGEVFTHRNIGNVVNSTDPNCMSVLEYGINTLNTKHIIVCGHYDCGACKAVLTFPLKTVGFVKDWILNIKRVHEKWAKLLELVSDDKKVDLFCELNAIEQTRRVCLSPVVQIAWKNGQELYIHAVIYDVTTGLLKSLASAIDSTKTYLTVDLIEEGCILKEENLREALKEGILLTQD